MHLDPGSSLHAAADAALVVPVSAQEAVTHTQAFTGNVMALLMLWRALTDGEPRAGLARLPEAVAASLDSIPAWAEEVTAELAAVPSAAIAFGSGGASVAALEAALLCKEVAGIPAEGLETREGATSGMYALHAGHLALAIPTGSEDLLVDEAIAVCRATGADIIRLPKHAVGPPAAAAITSFPAALGLAAALGQRAGLDIDQPAWTSAYYATARTTEGNAP